MEILRCSHLTKTYKTGSNQVVALDNVDLALEKGNYLLKSVSCIYKYSNA